MAQAVGVAGSMKVSFAEQKRDGFLNATAIGPELRHAFQLRCARRRSMSKDSWRQSVVSATFRPRAERCSVSGNSTR